MASGSMRASSRSDVDPADLLWAKTNDARSLFVLDSDVAIFHPDQLTQDVLRRAIDTITSPWSSQASRKGAFERLRTVIDDTRQEIDVEKGLPGPRGMMLIQAQELPHLNITSALVGHLRMLLVTAAPPAENEEQISESTVSMCLKVTQELKSCFWLLEALARLHAESRRVCARKSSLELLVALVRLFNASRPITATEPLKPEHIASVQALHLLYHLLHTLSAIDPSTISVFESSIGLDELRDTLKWVRTHLKGEETSRSKRATDAKATNSIPQEYTDAVHSLQFTCAGLLAQLCNYARNPQSEKGPERKVSKQRKEPVASDKSTTRSRRTSPRSPPKPKSSEPASSKRANGDRRNGYAQLGVGGVGRDQQEAVPSDLKRRYVSIEDGFQDPEEYGSIRRKIASRSKSPASTSLETTALKERLKEQARSASRSLSSSTSAPNVDTTKYVAMSPAVKRARRAMAISPRLDRMLQTAESSRNNTHPQRTRKSAQESRPRKIT